MKVLFVASNRKGHGLSPFILNQKESLENFIDTIDVFLISGAGLINYVKSIRILRARCKVTHYDIIHAHYGFCGIIALISFLKRPIVVSFMGDDLFGTPDAKGKYSLISIFTAKTNKLISRLYDSIIVKSQQLGSTLPKIPFHVIPNGVDYEKFYPYDKQKARQLLDLNQQKIIIVFASSVHIPRKNFKLAKDAITILQDENIILLTLQNIPHQDVYLYFNAADLMLLLSFHEGSPNVIKEAMACNCPIVATDVGDIKEVMDGTKGCFICSFEPTDVARKIKQAIQFGQRTNGREVIKHLESIKIALQIIKVYESLL